MKRKRVNCDIFRDVFVWKQSSDDSAKNNCRRGECTIGFLISYQLQKRFEGSIALKDIEIDHLKQRLNVRNNNTVIYTEQI